MNVDSDWICFIGIPAILLSGILVIGLIMAFEEFRERRTQKKQVKKFEQRYGYAPRI